jgi:uncharacterized LabA/DUF88 family protein
MEGLAGKFSQEGREGRDGREISSRSEPKPRDNVAKTLTANRVGIFVDVRNMFYSAKYIRQCKLDYGKLLQGVIGNRQLVRAIAYIMHKPDVNQTAFYNALIRFGYEVKIKELKMRPDTEEHTTAKGSWNVGMTVDIMEMARKLDTIILITGDSDYAPLVEAVKVLGCRVEVVGFERSTSGDLIRAANQFMAIKDEWTFKDKKSEETLEGLPVDDEAIIDEDVGAILDVSSVKE